MELKRDVASRFKIWQLRAMCFLTKWNFGEAVPADDEEHPTRAFFESGSPSPQGATESAF